MNERVTLELDAETLARARAAGVDLSRVLMRALHSELPPLTDQERKLAAEQWYNDNKEAVDASNEYVEKHGLFSDGIRKF